ncbi:unannotated protein [freshwater metagenome]|uniref:Unannotated protein n=1 Tax=freshwater metagenome TaxID=449393 RepID=A0A6J7I784_9ZZZZ
MTEMTMDHTLQARLMEMLDRQEILDALLRYTRGIDRHDTQLAQSAYHADARDDHGPFIGRGHDLVEWANGVHDEAMSGHQHYVTNTVIDLDGDEAHVETYYIMAAMKQGTSEAILGGGRYVDRFERRDGRWAIAARICTSEWWADPAVADAVNPLGFPVVQGPSDASYQRPLTIDREDAVAFGPGSGAATPV